MGLPDTGRYFIALDLGQKVLSALWQAQEEMRVADAPDIRWTGPESMHLTLKFLGGSVARSAAEGAMAA
ncbi:MAG: 2'-5' RNA ligase family protein, partial [Candidatus Thalassarchaeaceae archaeon]|nr:2'-5' RNA ligase family protein [Candidatus Thalassarchaeaceae archaeon]